MANGIRSRPTVSPERGIGRHDAQLARRAVSGFVAVEHVVGIAAAASAGGAAALRCRIERAATAFRARVAGRRAAGNEARIGTATRPARRDAPRAPGRDAADAPRRDAAGAAGIGTTCAARRTAGTTRAASRDAAGACHGAAGACHGAAATATRAGPTRAQQCDCRQQAPRDSHRHHHVPIPGSTRSRAPPEMRGPQILQSVAPWGAPVSGHDRTARILRR
jgi:hypothetical protein